MPAPSFRDRLCELEPQNAQLREKYEENLRNIMEQKMTPIMRAFIVCVGVNSIAIAIFLGALASIHDELPPLARFGLAAGSAFAVAWAVLVGWTLKKGTWFGKIQPAIIAGLSWTFAVLMETCFLVLAPQFPDRYLGTVVIFSGLVILIGAGVGLLATRIGQTELMMRESFLRMEYRLAQLADELNKNRGPT
jgi:hypothetical protein